MTKPELKPVTETETNPLTEAISTPTTPDPFDAKALALPPDFFVAGGALNPKPKNVQVRKSHNQEWIRVHPDPDFRCDYGTIFLRDDREFYLLAPAISKAMRGHRHLKTVTIYTTYSRLSGKTFLWPVGIVGQPGQNKQNRKLVSYRARSRRRGDAAACECVGGYGRRRLRVAAVRKP